MSEQRSEEDILRGVLVVSIGKPVSKKEIPVLSIAENRKWKAELASLVGTSVGGMKLESVDDGAKVALSLGDRMIDMVIAYDQSAALGGREWIEANATDAQIYAIARSMIEVAFPFVRDLTSLLREVRASGLVQMLGAAGVGSSGEQPLANSTNGHSPDGASLPLVSSAS